jgi:SOS-response transcriptional repressor LexA
MIDANLDDGDFILVEKINSLAELKNDDIVVAVIEGMVVLKRIRISPKVIILYPENSSQEYQPIILSKDNFSIVGKLLDKIIVNDDDVNFVYDSN